MHFVGHIPWPEPPNIKPATPLASRCCVALESRARFQNYKPKNHLIVLNIQRPYFYLTASKLGPAEIGLSHVRILARAQVTADGLGLRARAVVPPLPVRSAPVWKEQACALWIMSNICRGSTRNTASACCSVTVRLAWHRHNTPEVILRL